MNKCLQPRQGVSHFVQHVAKKPDKFEIKSCNVADRKSKYLLNGIPYFGKDEHQPANKLQVDYVVLRLMEPLGIRAEMLKQIIYTCRTHHRVGESWHKFCQNYKSFKDRNSTFNKKCLGKFIPLSKHDNLTLTVYQGKVNKNVLLLSSQHTNVNTPKTEKI